MPQPRTGGRTPSRVQPWSVCGTALTPPRVRPSGAHPRQEGRDRAATQHQPARPGRCHLHRGHGGDRARAGRATGVPGGRAGGRRGRPRPTPSSPSSTAPTSRSSPSTRRARWTSTRRCTSSGCGDAASGSPTRSPTSPPSSSPAARSTTRRIAAGRRCTRPTIGSRCTRQCCPRAPRACCPTRCARPCCGRIDLDESGEGIRVDVERARVRSRRSWDYDERAAAHRRRRRARGAACCSRRSGCSGWSASASAAVSACRCPSRRSSSADESWSLSYRDAASRSRTGTRRSRCSPAWALPRSCCTARKASSGRCRHRARLGVGAAPAYRGRR